MVWDVWLAPVEAVWWFTRKLGVAGVLMLVGGGFEALGIMYVAEDVTKKPGVWRRRVVAKMWRGMRPALRVARKAGLFRPKSQTVHPSGISITASMGRPRVTVSRAADRPIEQKVADLEEDLMFTDDRVSDALEQIEDLERTVGRQPEKLRPLMVDVVDERLAREATERFPVKVRSFVCLLVGVVLVTAGGVAGSWR